MQNLLFLVIAYFIVSADCIGIIGFSSGEKSIINICLIGVSCTCEGEGMLVK